MTTTKPIGYWLIHLHTLLEAQFDRTLADLGVGRRHWQVLNTLGREDATLDDLTAALAPFWTEGAPELDDVLSDLAVRGWVDTGTDRLHLTEEGRSAHARISARVEETRGMVLKGLTREQYAETVRILSVMAANVEADLAAA